LGRPRPSLRTTLASFPQAATKKTTIIPVFTIIPVSNLATMLASPEFQSEHGKKPYAVRNLPIFFTFGSGVLISPVQTFVGVIRHESKLVLYLK
jgi:hypothetical protein